MGIVQRIGIGAPLTAYQFQRGKAQHDGFLKSGQEHAHEADGFEIFYTSHSLTTTYGYFKLIPAHLFRLSVAQADADGSLVCDVVLSYFQVSGGEVDFILEILLCFIQGVVLIDVLHIGHGL